MPKQISKTRRKLERVAKKVNKASGATQLSKYIGEGIAKRRNPAVKRTVTSAQAKKSAKKTAGTIASLAVGGVVGRAVAGVKKAKVAKKAVTHSSSKAFLKRTVGGHERAAMRQAQRRNATKRTKK